MTELSTVFAALADETRWEILRLVGTEDLSASALARLLPVTRQAIARHLTTLEQAGLVQPVRAGRELRYRALGAALSSAARRLDEIGAVWDQRLAGLKRVAESL